MTPEREANIALAIQDNRGLDEWNALGLLDAVSALRDRAEAAEADRDDLAESILLQRTDYHHRDAERISRLRDAEAEPSALRSLLRHRWIHSGYPDCGRQQMTTEEKALYDLVKRG